ncbi:MAG: sigma-54-dependent Fis family transcriptional regulator [Ectothiorhodospiraceae bacterium]|nr:sigma-54-dependent Fis family transcriptional regulator [Chromatiales bacterium]MCP5154585.1 sigma-54-dependent Fis family transcriptional regulator [Ectothiorhodospiraceae bacterium]
MRSLHVLIVEDEAAIRQVLSTQLRAAGHDVEHVGTGEAALERLAKGDVEIALCDIRLPDMSGIEVMRRSLESGADTAFLVMTAYASVSTAIEAMKAGASDYMIKPLRGDDLLLKLGQISELIGLRDENRRLKQLVPDHYETVCRLESPASRMVNRLVAKVAATEGTVLVTGESGTGKGVVARAIHAASRRSRFSLMNINCGAIPENLLETELFGHLKGAFTGAERAKKGLLREADGGTVLLDEISELPRPLQVKLLHAIEEKQVRPVGSDQSRHIDVRFVAATNRDLETLVREGTFREDLYYRLNVLHIHIPPLRERREDIRPLLRFFLESEPRRLAIPRQFAIEPEAEERLLAYDWPGNVRELQNVVDHALILAEGAVVTVDDLPPQVLGRSGQGTGTPTPLDAGDAPLRERVRNFEASVIRQAIDESDGDRQAAARRLGIGLSTLYRKLEDTEGAAGDA